MVGKDKMDTAWAYKDAYPLPLPASVEGEGNRRAGNPEHEGLGRFRVQMARHLMTGGNFL